MNETPSGREQLYAYLGEKLVGPAGGPGEVVEGRLDLQYMGRIQRSAE